NKMDEKKATMYGKFLGERYKNKPNIIWMIGGDIMGDKGTASWDALARAIKKADPNHIMTFHPRGRTTSAWWYNDREWLDFNMFQSGHRRYGQRNGDGDYTIKDNTEEDNWRYVDMSFEKSPIKPVIDGEPSYEDIPQGLHDFSAPRWQDYDVRRYAYWAVFAGCFGHTYGHNSIMQFMRPGVLASFGAEKPWWDAMKDPGYQQMKYLKWLMLAFPFTERIGDQSIIVGQNGERYDRIIATRGRDYLLVYNYSGKPMQIDLTKISGTKKNIWFMNPKDGVLNYVGEYDNKVCEFTFDGAYLRESDRVLIAVDSDKNYLDKQAIQLEEKW
ncbi:MAG: glycoside hydrolase family 140 protein, partial [Prevotella sp.]|nr:glycoside hydrolase family 140 protein [Prevotella sp.]